MKIALLGYGKMGKAIEEDALLNGHEIVLKINGRNLSELNFENLKKADVAIEFSKPATVLDNIYHCLDAGIPIVVGTTGWYDKLKLIEADTECRNATLFYASNFSIGVNIFFELNETLAEMMNDFPEYNVEMEEVHHTQKLDAPSGTAITLAEGVIKFMERKRSWVNKLRLRQAIRMPAEQLASNGSAKQLVSDASGSSDSIADSAEQKDHGISTEHASAEHGNVENGNVENLDEPLMIHSIREGDVKGIHTVRYKSDVDQLIISHEAFSRKGFAQGAVLAAEWIIDKKGVFNMRDLLGFVHEPRK